MNSVLLRLGVALSAFMVGVVLDAFVNTSPLVEKALSYPVKAVDSFVGSQIEIPERRKSFDWNSPTEIVFERNELGCFASAPKRIVMRTQGSRDEAAIVTEIDLATGQERRGKLDSHYYKSLLRFIEGQGYFAMDDQYLTGTDEGSVVRSSVSVGDRHKTIITASEGDAPPALWGIHYAIEGVLNQVSWEADHSLQVQF